MVVVGVVMVVWLSVVVLVAVGRLVLRVVVLVDDVVFVGVAVALVLVLIRVVSPAGLLVVVVNETIQSLPTNANCSSNKTLSDLDLQKKM